ncbi:hypothetical protein KEM48_004454 [Puccinia striiformis f. sp. tritici PST-130]|nr:hypothetical protein KEM48_004454 [Puccinia striiformis f. sp. tritici PST-130]
MSPIIGSSEPGTQDSPVNNEDRYAGRALLQLSSILCLQAVTAAQRVVSGPSNLTFASSPTTNNSSNNAINGTIPAHPNQALIRTDLSLNSLIFQTIW